MTVPSISGWVWRVGRRGRRVGIGRELRG